MRRDRRRDIQIVRYFPLHIHIITFRTLYLTKPHSLPPSTLDTKTPPSQGYHKQSTPSNPRPPTAAQAPGTNRKQARPPPREGSSQPRRRGRRAAARVHAVAAPRVPVRAGAGRRGARGWGWGWGSEQCCVARRSVAYGSNYRIFYCIGYSFALGFRGMKGCMRGVSGTTRLGERLGGRAEAVGVRCWEHAGACRGTPPRAGPDDTLSESRNICFFQDIMTRVLGW